MLQEDSISKDNDWIYYLSVPTIMAKNLKLLSREVSSCKMLLLTKHVQTLHRKQDLLASLVWIHKLEKKWIKVDFYWHAISGSVRLTRLTAKRFFFFFCCGTSQSWETSRQVILYTGEEYNDFKGYSSCHEEMEECMRWPQMSSLTARFCSKREEGCGETWLEATL